MNKLISISCLYLLFAVCAFPQNKAGGSYDLSECIEIALEHNLDLKARTNQAESAKVNLRQARNDRLPNLNLNYNLGINNGRSINPSTNDFINERLAFSNVNLGGQFTLFNGFRLKNSIKQSLNNFQAADMEREESRQNLILDVTLAYIQVLISRDQLSLTQSRLQTTEGQVQRLKSNYDEGQGNPADYTDMLGQYSMDELSILTAKNSLNEATLNLFFLMGIEPVAEARFEDIEGLISEDKYGSSAEIIYQEALENLATFKARQLRIDAANSGIALAKSDFFPSISLFGQIGSNYSSVSRTTVETGSELKETGDFVNLNSQNLPVLTNVATIRRDKIAYLDQLNNNLNSVVGVAVNIPIFNRFQTKNTISLQKLELRNSMLELQTTKLQFKQSVEDAYLKMENAFSRYQVLKQQVDAYQNSFRINQIRFESGVSNIVEYLTSKNNLDTANLNLLNAKFEYILRVKILDYYRGGM